MSILINLEATMSNIGSRIKELRERVGMSQQRLAELMGVSRPTISQIENGERKICTDELINFSEIFGVSVGSLLNLEKPPEIILTEEKKTDEKPKPIIRINVPQRNFEKFKEVLIYILNKIGSKPNVGEIVLYKLFYFIDFDFYEKYEEQLIGATYLKNRYGPTPIEFQKIVEKMQDREIEKIESKYFQYPQTKYLPLRKADLSKLKANEIEVIEDVLNRLSDKTASQISDYSHNDVPWLTTDDGKTIEYESVFYRTPPYSVREYEEDIQ